jgi:ABC-type multidrug transport system fused ATPase/permease subunit
VALVGIVGALAVSGVQSQKAGTRVSEVLNFLHLSGSSLQFQVAVIGSTAALILLGRTLISIMFTRRTLYFFARRSAGLSAEIISKLLKQNLLKIQERSSQETLFAVTYGVRSLMMGILANLVTLFSDFTIIVVLSIALLAVDPWIALLTAILFVGVAILMHKLLGVRAQRLGQIDSDLNIEGNSKILEVLSLYRESVVRDRRSYYADQIGELRLRLATTQAEITFMPNISKYIIETTLIVGAVSISALQFLTQDARHAVATLTVFIAAASRISPAALRLQQGAMTIKNNIGLASTTIALLDSFESPEVTSSDLISSENSDNFTHVDFVPSVSISRATLTYPHKSAPAISNINLNIKAGEVVAFVGPSGAGKTTLIDTLLGVLVPDHGEVSISGVKAIDAIKKWPGAVAYVPQDVYIIDGTVRENIAIGYPASAATDSRISSAIKHAHLEEVISSLPFGVDTQVGEKGTQLSGGQRQRLGIARALFTSPALVVLDEATSSLDADTEAKISDAILSLRGKATVILIAHRLSTVRNADVVYYMEDGAIQASGTFDEVRSRVPQFDRQAKLLGL